MLGSINFWTNARMLEFWENVKMLLETIQPGIMLTFAIVVAGLLLGIVVRLFKKTEKQEDTDDEIEIHRY